MRKKAERKLENAKKRLGKIEDLIGPYTQDVTTHKPRNHGTWIPSSHAPCGVTSTKNKG